MSTLRLLLLMFLALGPRPALAHKLNVFAHAEGSTIRGQAYFRGGVPAQAATVTALDPAGRELGKTTTDSAGNFAIEAHARTDHRLVCSTSDGHSGEYVIHAAELPASLPAGESTDSQTASPLQAAAAPDSPADTAAGEIRQLRTQVTLLREQLEKYQDRLQLRDLLGGIGFIIGSAGIAFYFRGRNRKVNSDRQP